MSGGGPGGRPNTPPPLLITRRAFTVHTQTHHSRHPFPPWLSGKYISDEPKGEGHMCASCCLRHPSSLRVEGGGGGWCQQQHEMMPRDGASTLNHPTPPHTHNTHTHTHTHTSHVYAHTCLLTMGQAGPHTQYTAAHTCSLAISVEILASFSRTSCSSLRTLVSRICLWYGQICDLVRSG